MAKKKRRQNKIKIKAPRLNIKAPSINVGKLLSGVEKSIRKPAANKLLKRQKSALEPVVSVKIEAKLHKITARVSEFISHIERKIGNEEIAIQRQLRHRKKSARIVRPTKAKTNILEAKARNFKAGKFFSNIEKNIQKELKYFNTKNMKRKFKMPNARTGINDFFSSFGKKIEHEEHALQNTLKNTIHKNGKAPALQQNELEKTNGHNTNDEWTDEKHIRNGVVSYSPIISVKAPAMPKANGKKLHALHDGHVKTGVPGFDSLFTKGIPKGSSVLIAGGPGTGKTIFCLQTLYNAATRGEKCLYMSFEENEEKLRQHMRDFGWDPAPLEKKGFLMIKRFDPFDVTRSVEALLTRAKKELLIDIQPVFFPDNFKPTRIVVDSLSAVASAFVGREDSYRIYIEQLFRFFEELGATSFLVTEITHPEAMGLTKSGIEAFLADGIIMLHNFRVKHDRYGAIEILKMRGASFNKKVVRMAVMDGRGILVSPEEAVFVPDYGKPEYEL